MLNCSDASISGSQKGAVDASMRVKESMHQLGAVTDGLKASLVEGLSPALQQIVEEITAWFAENRERVKGWAEAIGQWLPGAIHRFADGFLHALDVVTSVIDKIGGLKTVAIALGAILVGPLVSSIITLTTAMASFGVTGAIAWGEVLLPILAVVAAIYAAKKAWDEFMGAGDARELSRQGKLDGIDAVVTRGSADGLDGIDTVVTPAPTKKGAPGGAKATGVGANATAVRDAVSDRGGFWNDPQLRDALMKIASNDGAQSKVVVDFQNAPRGTRVSTAPQSKGDVDFSVGYQFAGGGF